MDIGAPLPASRSPCELRGTLVFLASPPCERVKALPPVQGLVGGATMASGRGVGGTVRP